MSAERARVILCMKTITTLDDWIEKYSPIRNRFIEPDGAFDGTMFETYGEELEVVRKADPMCVWTLIDGDLDDQMYVVSGCHFVNRVGYFITEVPHQGKDICIPVRETSESKAKPSE